MADSRARVAIKPAKTAQVVIRFSEGQRDALVGWGREQALADPTTAYRWLNSDGDVNLAAVIRELAARQIPGFHQK